MKWCVTNTLTVLSKHSPHHTHLCDPVGRLYPERCACTLLPIHFRLQQDNNTQIRHTHTHTQNTSEEHKKMNLMSKVTFFWILLCGLLCFIFLWRHVWWLWAVWRAVLSLGTHSPHTQGMSLCCWVGCHGTQMSGLIDSWLTLRTANHSFTVGNLAFLALAHRAV